MADLAVLGEGVTWGSAAVLRAVGGGGAAEGENFGADVGGGEESAAGAVLEAVVDLYAGFRAVVDDAAEAC